MKMYIILCSKHVQMLKLKHVALITRSDVAEQSGEVARSLSGPILRYAESFTGVYFLFDPLWRRTPPPKPP